MDEEIELKCNQWTLNSDSLFLLCFNYFDTAGHSAKYTQSHIYWQGKAPSGPRRDADIILFLCHLSVKDKHAGHRMLSRTSRKRDSHGNKDIFHFELQRE